MNEADRVKEVIVDSRIAKVLALRTDSITMLESLDAISEFYQSNTAEARKSLRTNLELQNIEYGKQFLREMENMRGQMERVENLSSSLQQACDSLAKKVVEADENMKQFIEKANQLELKKQSFVQQSEEIKTFLSKYHLSDDEIELLHRGNLENTTTAMNFFQTIQRLKRAYQDCKNMTEKQFYHVGFELLDVLGQHQDNAYLHLFEWVKAKCELLAESSANVGSGGVSNNNAHDLLDNPELNHKLQYAIRILKDVGIYFSQCQDLLINARRTQLVHRFMTALTQGDQHTSTIAQRSHQHASNSRRNHHSSSGSSGSSSSSSAHSGNNALDLLSHDAIAYVGAMLAWMHQAVAAEQEFFDGIFSSSTSSSSSSSGVDQENLKNTNGSTFLSMTELLARTVQGVGRPLRVRISQTLENNPGLEVLYALADLLSFYEHTFARIIRMENAVHSTIRGCLQENKRLFVFHLRKQAESLKQSPISHPVDLKVSMVAKECSFHIGGILKVCNNSLSDLPNMSTLEAALGSTSTDGDVIPVTGVPNALFKDNVLGDIIQPLLQSCRLGGQALQSVEMAVYMLNNVSFLQHEISEASSSGGTASTSKRVHVSSKGSTETSAWKDLLEKESETWIDLLVNEEVSRALRRSDIDKIVELLDVLPSGLKASEQMGLQKDRIETVMRAFYASLFTTVSPQFERLSDPNLRESIRLKVAQKISSAHAKVYGVVSNNDHGYDKSILAHTVEEVNVLLGSSNIDGVAP